jgi:hypothetical protein
VDVVDLLDIGIKLGVLVHMMKTEIEGHIMIDVTEVTGEVREVEIEEVTVTTVVPDLQCQEENATTCMVEVAIIVVEEVGVEEEVEVEVEAEAHQ